MELLIRVYIIFAAAWGLYAITMYHALPRYKSLPKSFGIALKIFVMNVLVFPFAVWYANKNKVLTVNQYYKYHGKKKG